MLIDASVAVKWLVNEAFSDEAALLDNRATLIAPDILFAEATNALWALCRRGDITRQDFAEAVGVLKAAPVAFLIRCASSPPLLRAWRSILVIRRTTVSTWRSRFRSNIPSSPRTGVSPTPSASIRICRIGLCMWRL